MGATHQTVRLARGRHRSPQLGVCVMELASMLAGERFSDRPRTASPVIAAFLRTYNDGLDDERRQDLYQLASVIVGTAAARAVERERMSRCLEFARSLGSGTLSGRAAIAIASAEASGTWAALAALRTGPSAETHARVLAFVHELAAMRPRPARRRRWRRLLGRDPGEVVSDALAQAVRAEEPKVGTTACSASATRPISSGRRSGCIGSESSSAAQASAWGTSPHTMT